MYDKILIIEMTAMPLKNNVDIMNWNNPTPSIVKSSIPKKYAILIEQAKSTSKSRMLFRCLFPIRRNGRIMDRYRKRDMLKNIQNAKEFNPFLIEAVNKVTIQGIFFMYDVVFVEITPKQVATMSTIDKHINNFFVNDNCLFVLYNP